MKEQPENRTMQQVAFTRFVIVAFFLAMWMGALCIALIFIHLDLSRFRMLGPVISIVAAAFIAAIVVRLSIRSKSREIKVALPYGSKLLRFAIFLFSPKTQIEIFEPLVSDWQEEYFEAINDKLVWKARWINFRYTYAFFAVVLKKTPVADAIVYLVKLTKS